MKRHIKTFLWLASMLTPGCKTTPPLIPRTEIKEISVSEFIHKLDSASCRQPFYSARFTAKVKMKGNTESQFKGKLRLLKDSVIWCSIVPALGIEAGRLMATPAGAELINYINKEYLSGSYEFISKLADFPVTFQTLLTLSWPGAVLLHPKEAYQVWVRGGQFFLSPLDFKTLDKLISEKITAVPAHIRQPFVQALWISPQQLQVTRMLLYDLKQNRLLEMRREEKAYVSGPCLVATRQEFRFQSDSSWVQVQLEFLKSEFPADIDFPFSIPENYTHKELR